MNFEVEGQRRPLPSGVELAIYRTMQHALVAVRGDEDEPATVQLRYLPTAIDLEVRGLPIEGSGAAAAVAAARERVTAQGGSFTIAPSPRRDECCGPICRWSWAVADQSVVRRVVAHRWFDRALAIGFSVITLTQLFGDPNATHSAPAALLVVALCSTLVVRGRHPVAAVAVFAAGVVAAAVANFKKQANSPRRGSPGDVHPRLLVRRACALPARAVRGHRAHERRAGGHGLLRVPERGDRLPHDRALVGRSVGRSAGGGEW